MTNTEQVTDFKLEGATVVKLLNALNAHLKTQGCEPEEYGFAAASHIRYGDPEKKIPGCRDYRWLVAFVVEGGSEGYYVHVGAILARRSVEINIREEADGGTLKAVYTPSPDSVAFLELGLAKTYSPDSAYAICREAQRFLTAAAWN